MEAACSWLAGLLVLYVLQESCSGISYSAPPVIPPATAPVWRTYTSSSYYYTDYSYPKSSPKNSGYLPPPQFCPDTGKTLCKSVEDYPEEQIFHVITSSKTRRFNLSSLFVDERDGDQEPNMSEMPDGPPRQVPHHDGYIVYQTSVHYDYHIPTNPPWATYRDNLAPSSAQHPINQRYYKKKRAVVRRNQDEEPACPVRTMFVPPRAALNDQSQWKYIVNVQERDARFKQIIRVDICQSPSSQCSGQISLPFGYTSRCRQKYIKKKLLSLNGDGQGTSTDNFFIPSCCVCEIVRNTGK